MLTTLQKARILANAGIPIPAFLRLHAALDGQQGLEGQSHLSLNKASPDSQTNAEAKEWNKAVEALHVQFVAVRAARSLRQAHETDLLHRLRAANAKEPVPRLDKKYGLR